MRPYRSSAPPSIICSARDGCWRTAFQRPVLWWRHCSIAGPTATWPKPRPRSTVWQACARTASSYATSCCCDYTLYWRGLTAMPRPTRTCGIATATRPERLATRDISPTGRAAGVVGALDAKWASPIVKARRHDPPGPRRVKRGQVVVCWPDGSLGSMSFVSSPAPWVISMRRGLALAATGRVTVSTPF
jgi:hypothetical protein